MREIEKYRKKERITETEIMAYKERERENIIERERKRLSHRYREKKRNPFLRKSFCRQLRRRRRRQSIQNIVVQIS